MDYVKEIKRLKSSLDVTLVAHYYQRDEVFDLADITGDSLELAKRAKETTTKYIVFCGVGFMGQSVKILSPQKRVLMPKVACCAMARMIDEGYFEKSLEYINKQGIKTEDLLPITYINSSAEVKARVGRLGGIVCTSSNAYKIIEKGLSSGKKIFFLPDRCLGQNFAKSLKLKSVVIGDGQKLDDADIICYDGFCSVHQQFSTEDVEFYKQKFPDIKIAVHPECDPSICELADFVGSTSQLIEYIKNLPLEQKVAVGTEFNMVNRLREKNTYILSSTKPECPTMNETTLKDVYEILKSIEKNCINKEKEIFIDDEVSKFAKLALQRMFEI